MNKTQTLELLVPQMEAILSPLGFRYLKSQEKFTLTEKGDKRSLGINVTYWSSSDYTMFTPVLGVHFKKIEKFKEKYLDQRYDSHYNTFHLRGDNIPDIRFWSFESPDHFVEQKKEIEDKMKAFALPLLDRLSSVEQVVSMCLKREYDNFMNEYDRLLTLLCYVGAYEKNEKASDIMDTFDSYLKSMNQLIPHHKKLLSRLVDQFPELTQILETNDV